jgi:hypothetical protein
MNIRSNCQVSTNDFWYDLAYSGNIKPREICESKEDADRINEAVELVREFQELCEEYIDNFVQGIW